MGLRLCLLTVVALRAGALSAEPASAWTTIRDEDGIRVSQLETGEELIAFRAEAEIAAPIALIASVLVNVERRSDWMPMLIENKVVRVLSDSERIEYMAVKTPPLVKERDFVFRGRATFDKARRVLHLDFLPASDAAMPPSDDFVRGEVVGGGWRLVEEPDAARTRVEYGVTIDPRGAIPTFVVNAVASKAPFQTVALLREYMAQKKVEILPEVRRILDAPSEIGSAAPPSPRTDHR